MIAEENLIGKLKERKTLSNQNLAEKLVQFRALSLRQVVSEMCLRFVEKIIYSSGDMLHCAQLHRAVALGLSLRLPSSSSSFLGSNCVCVTGDHTQDRTHLRQAPYHYSQPDNLQFRAYQPCVYFNHFLKKRKNLL